MPNFSENPNINKQRQQTQMPRFRGNGFTIFQPPGWEDKTLYTITGPVEDEVQHNIIILVDQEVPFNSVMEYGEAQVMALEQTLKGCRMLKKGAFQMRDGTQAYRVIYRWEPAENRRMYQDQIYLLVGKTGYKLTATFSKKTRKTLGPLVERIMMSFKPEKS
jgi:hypothetical protein